MADEPQGDDTLWLEKWQYRDIERLISWKRRRTTGSARKLRYRMYCTTSGSGQYFLARVRSMPDEAHIEFMGIETKREISDEAMTRYGDVLVDCPAVSGENTLLRMNMLGRTDPAITQYCVFTSLDSCLGLLSLSSVACQAPSQRAGRIP